MGKLLNLVAPFFSTPKNYDEVLKKLAGFTFYEIYAITLVLRANPAIGTFFDAIEAWGPIGKLVKTIPHYDALNISGFLAAFLIAALSHMLQFHDRISDAMGIRRKFDVEKILVPLAKLVGCTTTNEKETEISKHRDSLMRAVFYRYASSRAESPLVDKHDIEHALNAWSWFWVLVEAIAYFSLAVVVALLFGSNNIAIAFSAVLITCLIISFFQFRRLGRYSRAQIESIAGDATAALFVKQQFDAL